MRLKKSERLQNITIPGQASAEEIAAADWTLKERMQFALRRVGLEIEPETPIGELSGGERTRASLAGLIFNEPDFLLLDEPTNNLDRDGRDAVISLLSDWRGGAIVVSHDRELLDHMQAIVELTSLGLSRYGGNWSSYRELKAIELAAAEQGLAHATKHSADVKRSEGCNGPPNASSAKTGPASARVRKAVYQRCCWGLAKIERRKAAERTRAWPSVNARRLSRESPPVVSAWRPC